jgi:hypothetical protein
LGKCCAGHYIEKLGLALNFLDNYRRLFEARFFDFLARFAFERFGFLDFFDFFAFFFGFLLDFFFDFSGDNNPASDLALRFFIITSSTRVFADSCAKSGSIAGNALPWASKQFG